MTTEQLMKLIKMDREELQKEVIHYWSEKEKIESQSIELTKYKELLSILKSYLKHMINEFEDSNSIKIKCEITEDKELLKFIEKLEEKFYL